MVSKNQHEKNLSLGVAKFGLTKKSQYRSRKHLVLEKVLVSVSKTFGLEKSLDIGLKNIWSQKKSRYQSRMKFLVSSHGGSGCSEMAFICFPLLNLSLSRPPIIQVAVRKKNVSIQPTY